jgi:hypothetical protein
MSRLDREVAQYEANQYFDCQEIIDILVSSGMSEAQIDRVIAMRHARALNDFTVLLARAIALLQQINSKNDQ